MQETPCIALVSPSFKGSGNNVAAESPKHSAAEQQRNRRTAQQNNSAMEQMQLGDS
jgi:hypothetical protein